MSARSSGVLVLVTALLSAGVYAEVEHPPGWSVGGDGYTIHLDRERMVGGAGSLRIGRVGPGNAGFAMRRIARERLTGTHVRLSASISARDVDAGYAGMFLRFDAGSDILYLDNMRDRGVTGTTDWQRHEIIAAVPDDAEWLVYGALLSGDGDAWFDSFHVEHLDASDLPDAPPEAVAYVERALGIIERHALRRDRVDWSATRSQVMAAAQGIDGMDAAHTLLRNVLRQLGDPHSRLMAPPEAHEWRQGEAPDALPLPVGELVAGRFGYVDVPRFNGDREDQVTLYADTLQQLLRTHADACGWVVDLRGNGGGNMWPMLAGLGPLTGDGRLGGLEDADGRRAYWWYRDGASGIDDVVGGRVSGTPLPPLDRPVAVLVGPSTASSGEAVALAFRGLRDTRLFGTATVGLTTGTQLFVLSDGAMLWLETSVFVDRDGRRYGSEVEPDQQVVPTGDDGDDPVRAAALRWLGDRPGCL